MTGGWRALCRLAGLPTNADPQDVASTLRAQGAYNVLSVCRRHQPDHMLHDPDAQLADDLLERLAIADVVFRHHGLLVRRVGGVYTITIRTPVRELA